MHSSLKLPSLSPWAHWNTEALLKEKERNPRSFSRGFQMKEAFAGDTEAARLWLVRLLGPVEDKGQR